MPCVGRLKIIRMMSQQCLNIGRITLNIFMTVILLSRRISMNLAPYILISDGAQRC